METYDVEFVFNTEVSLLKHGLCLIIDCVLLAGSPFAYFYP